jgi:acetolactate synthase-1/2/3 large subunit
VAAAGAGEPLDPASHGANGGIGVVEVFAALNEVLAPEDIVIEEAVTNGNLLYQNLVRSLPRTIAGAFAPGLGWALGGALGVKLAHRDRRVISICGDGSFLFAVPASALMMSAEMDCPFLTVVLNNGGYRASRLPVYELFPDGQSASAEDATGTRFLSAPDFSSLAVACHAIGEKVLLREELVPALQRALKAVEAGTSVVLDVHIEQN